MDKFYKPYYKVIDTRRKIEIIIADLSTVDKIAILESIGKHYRRENSKKMNANQMGRVIIDERPDEINLKP